VDTVAGEMSLIDSSTFYFLDRFKNGALCNFPWHGSYNGDGLNDDNDDVIVDDDDDIQFSSFQFFIIYVPSQQLQGKLQTQHNVDTVNFNGQTQFKAKDTLQEITGRKTY
jgi:hypothetical protein